MRYLYLVKDNGFKCAAYRTPDQVTMLEYIKAKEAGYKWLTEEEAVIAKLEIPNSSRHFGVITRSRVWEVKTKVEDGCIWAMWHDKWRAIRAYNVKGKTPSEKVMQAVEATFRLNSGIPINDDVKFLF